MFSANLCSPMLGQIVNKRISFNYVYLKCNFINEFILFAKMEMQFSVFNKD